MRTAVRSLSVVLLAILLYVMAGELLQAWVHLHFDAWRDRKVFGSERDRIEWQRVDGGLGLAQSAWPWKSSFHHDAARLQLFGVHARFVRGPDAGAAILDAVDRALARGVADGDLLVLEVRGCVLYGDYVGAADAVDRLMQVAPHASHYWRPLAKWLRVRSAQDPALRDLAAAVSAHAAMWR